MFITEKAREIPVKGEYDVIVCGSGPSGFAAAVMAGRMGVKVLLLDAMGSVGGISTSGMMSHFTGDCNSNLYHEILQRAADKNPFETGRMKVQINHELMKLTYYEMLAEANVTTLLYTTVCDVVMEGDTLTGVICENKGGRCAYLGKVIVDGTGDGDVAAKAGAEYVLGRESDGAMQPATLMFQVAGVDMERAVFPESFETLVDTEKGELQHLASELLPKPAGHVLLYKSTIPGIVTCNMTNVIGIDGTKAEDLTRAEIVCHEQMPRIVDFLRQYVPGYENCYIIGAANLIGIRETRHFKGLYTLTGEDILAAKLFDDWVVRDARFNFDVHNLTGSGLDKTGAQKYFPQSRGYSIPYGCMVPEKIDGLLLSGRNISGTHMAHSNYRVMPICVGIGEAAGMAAAIAVKKGILPREVDPKEIRAIQHK